MKVNLVGRLYGVTLLGSLDTENGHWHLACSLAVFFCSLCAACGWAKDICVEQSVTPAVWLSSGPWKLDLVLPSAKVPQFRTNGLEILPLIASATPSPVPPGIWGQKTGQFMEWAHPPWTKVKGFALTASENTGLAWELTELSSYTLPLFQIQLLLILSYETFWKKRRNSATGGAGHLFQSFCLAASVSIHFLPLKRERNIGLPMKTFNCLYLPCVSLENNNKC